MIMKPTGAESDFQLQGELDPRLTKRLLLDHGDDLQRQIGNLNWMPGTVWYRNSCKAT
ncbi:hypothetical protein DPMN_027799 [Dreissena polymorpha]|uniref:Uncharacterized protein n=1 Tax=Dreissena polymorpha TaxID=45954 RepID=A0A9D4LU72_DREPO|nr:hypothetical protein DPMN_027799 [Dreissena polymorpha]